MTQIKKNGKEKYLTLTYGVSGWGRVFREWERKTRTEKRRGADEDDNKENHKDD